MVSYKELIDKVADKNTWGCSIAEYSYMVDLLLKKGFCNFLVFGLGRDTELWNMVNSGGKTTFIENIDSWINKFKSSEIDIRKINYTTKRIQWKELLKDEGRLLLILDEDIKNTNWDYIFIDSPMGGNDSTPGRMQSIYTASTLKCSEFFIHDINRKVEKTYGDKYLGTEVKTIDRLTHYKK